MEERYSKTLYSNKTNLSGEQKILLSRYLSLCCLTFKAGTGPKAMSQMTLNKQNKKEASSVLSQMKIHIFYGAYEPSV